MIITTYMKKGCLRAAAFSVVRKRRYCPECVDFALGSHPSHSGEKAYKVGLACYEIEYVREGSGKSKKSCQNIGRKTSSHWQSSLIDELGVEEENEEDELVRRRRREWLEKKMTKGCNCMGACSVLKTRNKYAKRPNNFKGNSLIQNHCIFSRY